MIFHLSHYCMYQERFITVTWSIDKEHRNWFPEHKRCNRCGITQAIVRLGRQIQFNSHTTPRTNKRP